MCINCCNLMEEDLKFTAQTYGMGKILEVNNDGLWYKKCHPLFSR